MIVNGRIYKSKRRNASGTPVWKARWMPHKGASRREKNFRTKREAEQYLDELRAGTRTSNSVSMAELHEEWRAVKAQHIKPTTLAMYDDGWRRFIKPEFENRADVSSITTRDVERFAQWLAKVRRSPRSRGMILSMLSGMLNYALKHKLIPTNPCTTVDKPTSLPRDVYVLTPMQQQKLLASAPDLKSRVMFTTAMYTGMRLGETVGLKWAAVDFESQLIHIREQFTHGAWSTPKSNRNRLVPIDDRLTEWLRNWRAHTGKTELVFPSNVGKPMNAENLRHRVFKPALKHSGIADEVAAAGSPVFRWHDLRHVYASILLGAGASIYDVQCALGHSSVVTTEKLYAHLTQDHFADLRQRLSTVTAQVDLEVPGLRAVP